MALPGRRQPLQAASEACILQDVAIRRHEQGGGGGTARRQPAHSSVGQPSCSPSACSTLHCWQTCGCSCSCSLQVQRRQAAAPVARTRTVTKALADVNLVVGGEPRHAAALLPDGWSAGRLCAASVSVATGSCMLLSAPLLRCRSPCTHAGSHLPPRPCRLHRGRPGAGPLCVPALPPRLPGQGGHAQAERRDPPAGAQATRK